MLISSVHKSPTGKKGEKKTGFKKGSHQPKAPARAKASKLPRKVFKVTPRVYTHTSRRTIRTLICLYFALPGTAVPLSGTEDLMLSRIWICVDGTDRAWNARLEDVGTAENMRGCSTFPGKPCSIFLTLTGRPCPMWVENMGLGSNVDQETKQTCLQYKFPTYLSLFWWLAFSSWNEYFLK